MSGLKPEGQPPSSSKKVHWVCHKHAGPFTWAASIKSRTKAHKPTGCPQCAREAGGPSQGKLLSPPTCAVTSGGNDGERHYC